jgi:hypothetical protein
MISGLSVSAGEGDSLMIRRLYDEALMRGHAYENLRSLCKDVGARLSGSSEAEMAVNWGKRLLESYDFDSVWLQEIKVPHWERGTTESGWIVNEAGKWRKLSIIALGGSVGTDGLLEGDIVEVQGLTELEHLGREQVEGRVVFFNRPFDQSQINTFRAYGACVDQRWEGANAAGKLNAKAVIIRSLASSPDNHPHTGVMHYDEGGKQIPAAAISTLDADWLTNWLRQGSVQLRMEMDCRNFDEAISYNVIAEMHGSEDNSIITFGGHLDSWDVGEGAHDDGAGIIHSIEALRLLKVSGYQPRHRLRCVLFMNEENGNRGGRTYAAQADEKGEKHICALESDRGGFLPIGFDIVGDSTQVEWVREIKPVVYPFGLFAFDPGYGGVDINPLREYYPDILMLGLAPNSQEYFDYHHSDADVFEAVNKRELELGCAAMATMLFWVDSRWPVFDTEISKTQSNLIPSRELGN